MKFTYNQFKWVKKIVRPIILTSSSDSRKAQYYEVLEGLEPGEKVITSGYDNFGDNNTLIF